MVRIVNVSPLGDLAVPDLRRLVAAGEVVEVDDDDLAAALLAQPANWATAPAPEEE